MNKLLRVLFLLLVISSPLFCEVKILMPVVVKDAAGKSVSDLKISDFQVTGPKNVSIEKMWFVLPETVSKEDARTPVLVLYDAANARNPYPSLRTKWIREFLRLVAKDRLPVTFVVNAVDGLQPIYVPTTPPEVLTAALELTDGHKPSVSSAAIQQQAARLALLNNATAARTFHFDSRGNQLNSLIEAARMLGDSENRKAVIWLADETFFPASDSHDHAGGPPVPMYETMVEQLNAARVSVYPDLFSWTGFSTVGHSYYWYYAQRLLAECTGGLSFTKDSIGETLQSTLSDFGSYYMLAVVVPNPKTLGWMPIKIAVKRPGLTVRAAPGFVGLPSSK